MTLVLLVEQIFNGVQFGLMLFLMAVGVTLVFGIMRVINLAHGSLFMVGGYLSCSRGYGATGSYCARGAARLRRRRASVGAVLEILVLRPLYRRGPLDQVLATFGLTMFFNEAVVVIWGRVPLNLDMIPRRCRPCRDLSGRQLSGLSPRHHRRRDRCGVLLYFIIVAHAARRADPRRLRQARDRRGARRQYRPALHRRSSRSARAFAALAGMHDGAAAVGRVRHGRSDPDPDAGGDRDRRHRLGARRARRRAAGRRLRHVHARAAARDRRT